MRGQLYLAVTRQSFSNALAYRANYYTGLARELFFLYLGILLWRALYESGAPVAEATVGQTVAYIALSRLLIVIRQVDLRPLLESRVISGEIASDLVRPYDFQAYLFARVCGTSLHNLLMKSLPMLLVAALLWGVEFEVGAARLLLFLVSFILGYLVAFLIDFITGMMAFWTTEMWSFSVVKFAIVTVLSGALVPLWLYPAGFSAVIEWLPFAAVAYIPLSIYVGYLPPDLVLPMLVRQALWIGILLIICRLIWLRAVARLAVQGG